MCHPAPMGLLSRPHPKWSRFSRNLHSRIDSEKLQVISKACQKIVWLKLFFLKERISCQISKKLLFNRYSRGLETCSQAKASKSGHAIFFSFFSDAFEQRVWFSAESKILASTFGRFCLYRFKFSAMSRGFQGFHFL